MSTSIGSRVRPTPLAFLAIGWLALIDAANRFNAGPGSLAAVLSVGSVAAMVLALLNNAMGTYREAGFATPGRTPLPRALWLFAVWAVVLLPFHPTFAGFQNVTVYLGFILGIAATGSLCSPAASAQLLRRLRTVGGLVAVIYLATTVQSGLEATTVYSARSVALAGLVLLGVAVVEPRKRLLPTLLMLVIVVSLSRTATLMALLVLALGLAVRSGSRGRAIRILALLTAGVGGAWLAFTKFAPLRDRFQGGDQAFAFGGSKFNVSGRSELWSFTLKSAKKHLWFGDGPGSADAAVLHHFITISHPHNDYLRLLHDFGIVGMALFLMGYLSVMRRTWVLGRTTGQPVHWAAFLGLLGVAGAAATDNVLIYPFVMIPLGILVGASLSASPVSGPRTPGPDARSSVAEVAGGRAFEA